MAEVPSSLVSLVCVKLTTNQRVTEHEHRTRETPQSQKEEKVSQSSQSSGSWRMAQVRAECLPSIHEALGLLSSAGSGQSIRGHFN